MKTFIYTITKGRRQPNGYTPKTIKAWRIVNNQPRYLGSMTHYCMTESQMFMEMIRTHNLLPKKYHDCMLHHLVHDGVVSVHQL